MNTPSSDKPARWKRAKQGLTLLRSLERDVKLVHLAIDERHFIVAHQAVRTVPKMLALWVAITKRPPGKHSNSQRDAQLVQVGFHAPFRRTHSGDECGVGGRGRWW